MSDSFVTLESNDGYTFVVPRHIAVASETLKAMLDEEGELPFILLPPKLRFSCVVESLS